MKKEISGVGFLNVDVDASLDLFSEIRKMQKEKNAVILAHYYQEPDIQDIADFVGDSLGLAQEAARTDAEIILFAGVHFMAETAKIINPKKKVILPDLNAGCSLSDSCPADKFAVFKKLHPDHKVITYINCSVGLKALSDVVVTSTNAAKIVDSFPKDQKLIFAPDKNLGAYLNKKTGRDMVLWDGACMVHEVFSHRKIVELKTRHPNAKIIAHPECVPAVLELADYIGSTSGLLKYTKESGFNEFIVVTEAGIIHQMEKANPDKKFIPAPNEGTCACNDCPHMKLNTLEKLYISLKYELPEITMDEELRLQALAPIERMLELSKSIGG
jgi:quinolinate synthase